MNHESRLRHRLPSVLVWTLAAISLAAPYAQAQYSDWCCFANRRFTGLCTVTPSSGDSCSSALSYLNNLGSAGKAYCGNTYIRQGWRQVDCEQSLDTSSGVFMDDRESHLLQAVPAGSTTPDRMPDGRTADDVALPYAAETRSAPPVTIRAGSVLKVSMDGPIDLDQPGQSFTARLDADRVAGGSVIAPRGASVSGRVTTSEWGPAQPMLQLTSIEIDDRPTPIACSDSGGPAGAALPDLGVRLEPEVDTLADGESVTFGPAIPLLSTPEEVEMTRSSIQAQRQAIVAASLTLSDQESIAFWPRYREYRREMEEVGDRTIALIADYRAVYAAMTDKQAEALLDEAVAIEVAALEVRKKHLVLMREVLPGKKVARFFQVENRLDTAIDAEISGDIPLVR